MSLQLIVGCMFSGKSTELIRRIRRFQSIGKRVCVVNHNLDNRDGNTGVATHYGDNVDSLKYSHLMNFVNIYDLSNYDVICIDEGQFFDDLRNSVKSLVEVYKLQVVVAGLTSDFRREPFGDMLSLMLIADDVLFCKAYCGVCQDGTLASFTKRLSDTTAQVDIGSKDKYLAVCRKCYLV